MRAVLISETGGPEVLVPSEVPDPTPGAGEMLVDVDHAGVNFIDTYQRIGRYPLPTPFISGVEGSGVVAAVGEGATDFSVGDRVAWSGVQGSYAELLGLPADRAVAVPEAVSLDDAAAVMLQGMTAHYLVHDTFPLQSGDRTLIHAGAGGVGRLVIQMAKRVGAEVFATVGSEDKMEIARDAGADHIINYNTTDFREAIEAIAGPRPLDVVYDGVGASTFDESLALIRRRGLMASFGSASGVVPPVDPLRLTREGSLFLTRPSLGDYVAGREELVRRAAAVLGAVATGELNVLIDRRFDLDEAADAHRALEGRETVGKLLITTR